MALKCTSCSDSMAKKAVHSIFTKILFVSALAVCVEAARPHSGHNGNHGISPDHDHEKHGKSGAKVLHHHISVPIGSGSYDILHSRGMPAAILNLTTPEGIESFLQASTEGYDFAKILELIESPLLSDEFQSLREDRDSIVELRNAFDECKNINRNTGEADRIKMLADDKGLEHDNCRAWQYKNWFEDKACEKELARRENRRAQLHQALESLSSEIVGFANECPKFAEELNAVNPVTQRPLVGSITRTRGQRFAEYKRRYEEAERMLTEAEIAVKVQTPKCRGGIQYDDDGNPTHGVLEQDGTNQLLAQKVKDCDKVQDAYENDKCDLDAKLQSRCYQYVSCFRRALEDYLVRHPAIHKRKAERIVTVKVLRWVKCLLQEISKLGGGGNQEAALKTCNEYHDGAKYDNAVILAENEMDVDFIKEPAEEDCEASPPVPGEDEFFQRAYGSNMGNWQGTAAFRTQFDRLCERKDAPAKTDRHCPGKGPDMVTTFSTEIPTSRKVCIPTTPYCSKSSQSNPECQEEQGFEWWLSKDTKCSPDGGSKYRELDEVNVDTYLPSTVGLVDFGNCAQKCVELGNGPEEGCTGMSFPKSPEGAGQPAPAGTKCSLMTGAKVVCEGETCDVQCSGGVGSNTDSDYLTRIMDPEGANQKTCLPMKYWAPVGEDSSVLTSAGCLEAWKLINEKGGTEWSNRKILEFSLVRTVVNTKSAYWQAGYRTEGCSLSMGRTTDASDADQYSFMVKKDGELAIAFKGAVTDTEEHRGQKMEKVIKGIRFDFGDVMKMDYNEVTNKIEFIILKASEPEQPALEGADGFGCSTTADCNKGLVEAEYTQLCDEENLKCTWKKEPIFVTDEVPRPKTRPPSGQLEMFAFAKVVGHGKMCQLNYDRFDGAREDRTSQTSQVQAMIAKDEARKTSLVQARIAENEARIKMMDQRRKDQTIYRAL